MVMVDGYFVVTAGVRTTQAEAEAVEGSGVPHSLSRTEETGTVVGYSHG